MLQFDGVEEGVAAIKLTCVCPLCQTGRGVSPSGPSNSAYAIAFNIDSSGDI